LGSLGRAHDRIWRALAGSDGARRAGLPYDEALAPIPVLALVVLVVNDRVLKAEVPSWVTGKLSDMAGLAVAPLVLTAAIDVVLWLVSRTGAPVDWTFRRWKLVLSILATGGVFAAVKVWAPASRWLADTLAGVFGQARIVTDPTDLLALPALAIAWWHGLRTLAHVPYGRLQWAQRRRAKKPFADVARAGGDPVMVVALTDAVTAWTAGGPAANVDEVLAALRRP